jgi:hypothetical protein
MGRLHRPNFQLTDPYFFSKKLINPKDLSKKIIIQGCKGLKLILLLLLLLL